MSTCGTAALLAATLVAITPSVASAAGSGTMLLQDSFQSGSVTSPEYVVGGTNFTPCLTATGPTNANEPGQCTGASDTPGSGALRLTDATTNRAGFLLYNHALPTRAGLDIEFQFYEYGGNGADGISFFLTDGSTNLSSPGALGGSLGYHNNVSTPGVTNALLGVGLDAYGNFGFETNNAGCSIVPAGPTPDSVAVRGPGTGSSGYCLLGSPVAYSDGIDVASPPNRSAALRKARIVIDPPSSPSPEVKVYVASGSGGDVSNSATPLITVDEPSQFQTTSTFKFGWAASTGGQSNIHEINFLNVETVDPLPPELLVSTDDLGQLDVGDTGTVVVRPSVSSEAGPEPEDVTVDLSVPAGINITSTPTGTGWTCLAGGGGYQCTYPVTPAAQLISGTTLPPINVPVATATTNATGSFSVLTATVDSTDNGFSTPHSDTATGSWHPMVGSSAGAGVASSSPSTITLSTPTVVGTPINGYAITLPPLAGRGTASISPSGVPSFTPAAGTSGVTTFGYRAEGADGTMSLAQGIGTVFVKPVAPDRSASTTAGTPVTIPNSVAPMGTGPFTYSVVQPSSGGTASINPSTGVITFTPAANTSGTVTFGYVATDSSSVSSDMANVTVTVAPVVADTTLDLALNSSGHASGSTPAPSTTGGASMTFAKSSDPTAGSATVNSATGAVTYTAATGTSGTFQVGYRASDGGVDSAQAIATITVHPYLSTVAGSTDGSTPVTLGAPTAIGTGPLTYTVSAPSEGSATINSSTGAVTFDPQGHSGVATVGYTVTDTNGVSTTRTAIITVAPVTNALTATAVASSSPSGVALDATPIGDGPWTYGIVTGPDSSVGTAVATATGVMITPAPGVSGVIEATYIVRDAEGNWSASRTATLSVTPLAVDGAATVPSGSVTRVDLPTPVSSGTPTFEIVSGTVAGWGSIATIAPGSSQVTLDIPNSVSGHATITYRVTDPDSLESQVASLDVTVTPVAHDLDLGSVSASAGGATPVVRTPAVPYGSGPFTYELVAVPSSDLGAVSIDPATGQLTVTPAAGVSGAITFTYRVTDSHSLVSNTAIASLSVVPSTGNGAGGSSGPVGDSPQRSSTKGSNPVTIDPPTPVGTGPFTYRIVDYPDPSQGTVRIDPETGRITFVPADGYSGTARFSYEIVDAHGLVSAPMPVEVAVEGEAADNAADDSSGGPLELAFTGGVPIWIALAGAALVLFGSGASLASRRRPR